MNEIKIIEFHKKRNNDYYILGLIIGVLRAELENGTVNIDSAYRILSNEGKEIVNAEKRKRIKCK